MKSVLYLVVLMLACGLAVTGCTPDALHLPVPNLSGLPAMPWDARPEASTWTAATLVAVQNQDAVLASKVPSDIKSLCPGYAKANLAQRRDFWVALVALTAKAESGFNPGVTARGGYVGLMQISPKTARGMGCGVTSSAALKDGENNLFCAVQIMAGKVATDGQAVGPKGNQGIGRDWSPWRKASMRASAADWFSAQPYCR